MTNFEDSNNIEIKCPGYRLVINLDRDWSDGSDAIRVFKPWFANRV
jgi:hypothetical protein